MRAKSDLSLCLLVLALLLLGSCDDPSATEKLGVFIVEASPERGHAPLEVSLSADFAAEDDQSYTLRWDFGDGATKSSSQKEVVHRYETSGNYELSLELESSSGAKGSDRRTIEVLPSAELVITDVAVRPTELQVGDELRFSYTLRNDAAAVQLPFSTSVFLTTNPEADINDLDELTIIDKIALDSYPGQDDEDAVQSIEGSATAPLSLASGDYYLGVVADADALIGEGNEINNLALSNTVVRVRNPSSDGPDLIPSQLSVSPRRARILNSVTLDFSIRNQGLGPALAFGYEVFMRQPEGSETRLLEAQVPGLPTAGLERINALVVPIAPAISEPGEITFGVRIDPGEEIIEIDETNNSLIDSTPVVITDEAIIDADILAESLSLSPSSSYAGGSVMATVGIRNLGSVPTGSFICALYLSEDQVFNESSDPLLSSFNIFELEGDTEYQLERALALPSYFEPGEYWPFVACDSSGVVVEYDESNNIQRAEEALVIEGEADLDLFIAALVPLPGPWRVGDQVTLEVELCNAGATGAGPSRAKIYARPIGEQLAQVLADPLLPAVEANDCIDLSLEFSAQCQAWEPEVAIAMEVDVDAQLAESDEDNNLSWAEGEFTILGEHCSCEADEYEANDYSSAPAALSPGAYSASLCSGDLDWFSLSLEAGQSLRAILSYEPSLGELALELYTPSLSKLEEGQPNQGSIEVDTYLVQEAGDYLLQVSPASPGERNLYELELEVVDPQAGGVDLQIVDLQLPAAIELSAPTTITLSLINSGDQPTPDSFTLRGYVRGEELMEAIEIYESRQPAMNAMEQRSLSLALQVPGAAAGSQLQFEFFVDAEDEIAELSELNNHTLSIPFTVDGTCYDELEPNDTLDSASFVEATPYDAASAPLYQDLVVCKADGDFYEFVVANGQRLAIRTEGYDSSADLDLVLWDASGNELADSRGSAGDERIEILSTLGEQRYFLEVLQPSSAYNPESSHYDLWIETEPADPSLVCDATFEFNDSFSTATPLLEGVASPQALSICPADDQDFYRISLAAGTAVEFELEGSSNSLRAALYDGSYNFIQTLFGPGQSIYYVPPLSSTYYLRVFTSTGASRETSYQLGLSGINGADLVALSLTSSPAAITAGQSTLAAIELFNGGTEPLLNPEIAFYLSADAILDAGDELLAGYAIDLQLNAGASHIESIKLDIDSATLAGDYYLIAALDPADAIAELNEYNNQALQSLSITEPCLPDPYEGSQDNDIQARASAWSGADLNAWICPGDSDWFSIRAAAGTPITFELSFKHSLGDLDLALFDSAGTLLLQSQSTDDDESISLTPSSDDPLFLRVSPFLAASQNTYTLSIE